MSQVPFTFQFDLPSPESSAPQTSTSCQGANDASTTTAHVGSDAAKPHFKLVENISLLLRERAHDELEYDTVELNGSHDEKAVQPLFRVRDTTKYDGTTKVIQDLEERNTDLVPGVYEGGLKVWECSLDLCRYLAIHAEELVPSSGGSILELGCGHGLPGCLLLREGLQRDSDLCVMFTDYNDFVIRGVTLSNVVLNTGLASGSERETEFVARHVVMGAGDWMDMSSQLCTGVLQKQATALPKTARFNVILAAETTYTAQAAQDTATLMARHLVLGTGVGLVACKRYYFGVGGGSDAFRQAAASSGITITDDHGSLIEYCLSVETLQVYDNGVGNIRELLQVKCIPKR